jgi:YD repeat-containing protein
MGARDLAGDRAFTYDPLRRLLAARDLRSGRAETYAYDAAGNATAAAFANGTRLAAAYDALASSSDVGSPAGTIRGRWPH